MKLNLDEKISAAQTVAIAGHVKPDGDCVGSCLAVCQYIRRYFPQKQVQVFLEPIPRIFYFLQYAEDICEAAGEEDGRYDLFIALDCGDLQRLGKAGHGAVHTARRQGSHNPLRLGIMESLYGTTT